MTFGPNLRVSIFIGKANKYELVDFVVSKFKAAMGFGSGAVTMAEDKKEDFVQGLS